MSDQTILAIGASRGTGLFAILELVKQGASATLLLRNPQALQDNADYQGLSDLDKAKIRVIQGDAFIAADVDKAIKSAGAFNLVIYSLGAAPKLSWTGIGLDNPDACTRSSSVLLPALQKYTQNSPNINLRFIAVSTMGMGQGYYELPWLLRPVYALLHVPHHDKAGLEYLLWDAAGVESDIKPPEEYLPADFRRGHGGWLKNVTIVKAALLTDGARTGKFRSAEHLPSPYTISRRDIGAFVAGEVSQPKFVNKNVVVAY